MKRKISIPVLVLVLFIIFSISAFAGEIIGDKNDNSYSEAGIKVWDEFYPAKKNINGQMLYLYDMQEKNMNNAVMNLYLGEFFGGSRPFFRGQFAYLPIDNNGNPSDLSPLMNASNF